MKREKNKRISINTFIFDPTNSVNTSHQHWKCLQAKKKLCLQVKKKLCLRKKRFVFYICSFNYLAYELISSAKCGAKHGVFFDWGVKIFVATRDALSRAKRGADNCQETKKKKKQQNAHSATWMIVLERKNSFPLSWMTARWPNNRLLSVSIHQQTESDR